MPTLSDKLKSLGVKVGAQDLPPPSQRHPFSIEKILEGNTVQTPLGETYIVEKRYPIDYLHGQVGIYPSISLAGIAEWMDTPELVAFPPETFTFIDTETTGLVGGTGTYPFLIGMGRFEADSFHLVQLFMRDPLDEPAHLFVMEDFLLKTRALVSFNGKAFDVPLLTTRFITQGLIPPFKQFAHIDLLPISRRLWRDRLPSRTLGNLEVQILGKSRTEEDIPGWIIPSLYFAYLQDGDARPLKNVFYHNEMDVVSLAALLNQIATMMANPFDGFVSDGIDLVALAKLFESLGDLEKATRLYLFGLDHDLPKDVLLEAIQRLASIHKKQENLQAAVELWEQAARHQHLHSHIELAKFYEHQLKNYPEAIYWTQTAIELVNSSVFPLYEQRQWTKELNHRLDRLQKKASKSTNVT